MWTSYDIISGNLVVFCSVSYARTSWKMVQPSVTLGLLPIQNLTADHHLGTLGARVETVGGGQTKKL